MRFAVKIQVLLLALSTAALIAPAQTGVENSVHNLSSTGPGTTKAASDAGVCIFCHAPHNTQSTTPLWNKQTPPDNYQFYTSSTHKQMTTQISASSKLCLSCHDGTIALGQTVATGDLGVTPRLMPGQNSLGTDLRRDHPVSFPLPAVDDGELKPWLTSSPVTSPDPTVKLYQSKMECLTCHDPHVPDKDPAVKKFLVRDNQNGALCTTCHDTTKGVLSNWATSQHAVATNQPGMTASLAYSTVASNACATCHTSHNAAGTGPRLLRAVGSAACATCHSSPSSVTPAPPDVMSVVNNATYSHPITTATDQHDPAESLPVTGRHSDCADCHNPHATQNATTAVTPPAAQSVLRGINGMSADGTSVVNPVANQYEVCFKCHAGSSNKPQKLGFDVAYGRTPYRHSQVGLVAVDAYNTAKEFGSTLISRHNVTQSRSSYNSPSLRPNMLDLKGQPTGRSLLASGFVYCTDCHNSDQARSDGGAGASGPHGTKWQHLLQRRFEVNAPPAQIGAATNSITYTPGLTGPYAMCDKCHDVDQRIVNGADTVFGYHNRHVVQAGISCSSCHAPHGVQGSDSSHHGGLIDLDTAMVVNPDGTAIGIGTPATALINTSQRTCSLTCHGHAHAAKSYPPQ